MSFRTAVLFSILLFLVCSCSKTSIVLVPDPHGNTGKVYVSPLIGFGQLLEESGETINARAVQLIPVKPEILDPENLPEVYREVLENEPKQPTVFRIYFNSGSTELDKKSAQKISNILEEISNRKSCDIASIGHTDTVGDVSYNIALSRKRAEAIKTILINNGVNDNCISTISYGEKDPLVMTGDDVPEKVNRRVEVEVR